MASTALMPKLEATAKLMRRAAMEKAQRVRAAPTSRPSARGGW